MRMDELREAARVLAEEARRTSTHIESIGEVPSEAQLKALQTAVNGVQQVLNRLQTAMHTCAEEIEEG